jgi:branched-chain amino acid transport system permease protein
MWALVALGLNLQYGVTRILNVAHGDFLVVGCYITWALFYFSGLNPLVSLVISLVISGPIVFGLGVLIQMVVFRRLVSQSKVVEELEARSLLACFGLMFIIENVISAIAGPTPITVPYLSVSVDILGRAFGLNVVVVAVVSIILSLVMYLVLRFTRLGLAMRATVEEPAGAQLVGINTLRIHAVSFGLGTLLAAVAGSMIVMYYANISPFIGPQFTFIALAIIILGGMGSFIGSLVGGFIIGYIFYALTAIVPLLTFAVIYSVVIILLIIRPKGLFGR